MTTTTQFHVQHSVWQCTWLGAEHISDLRILISLRISYSAYPPFKLENNSTALQSALTKLRSQLDQLIQTGNGQYGPVTPNTTSFSIALFSTNPGTAADEPFFFDYHYTAPSLKDSTTTGVRSVDADSIYRIGGLTEVFTIWCLLIEAGDEVWNNPVTKYAPELEGAARARGSGDIDGVDWESITVGQLASHMSGISRDYGLGDLSQQIQNAVAYGFPGLPTDTIPACYLQNQCNRTGQTPKSQHANSRLTCSSVVMPGTTPVYSNDAFQILGYVVENITGESFENVLSSRILAPLGMNQTTLYTPKSPTLGVIPVNEATTQYQCSHLPAVFPSPEKQSYHPPSYPPSQTNRWLKPVTHTSNPKGSIGLPWIIYSAGDYPNTSMIDIYTAYDNLVPDYGFGFAILAADTESNPDLNAHADYAGNLTIDLIEIAMLNANATFTGSYTASSSELSGLNSSISISVDSLPGLIVDSFISNGTDFRKQLAMLYNAADYEALSVRLYPTHLSSTTTQPGGSRQVFRAVYQDKKEFADAGTPTCVSWRDVDKFRYGGAAVDLFVFDLDAEGKIVGVEIPALRVKLEKD
ncbi:alkaline D-peptidase, putative [Talaromyces stipitatus ATCC 10500]|uniref:Alkaline D-peptidase, putative n=1 Tax=Talaromyces stipitatus (strain ATCC 10500 / CBS 375.48 / QM 6759 / NRRL 1006) TaxID=441959 RepID=B8MLB8_TALSN|nr:alkaline D-peptidase, putative [Talaromyces stipitatus ATCC 10500]EED15033.1 alkaline D-peptidase, putative [Talaromyces stipitatus ATCC 10500]